MATYEDIARELAEKRLRFAEEERMLQQKLRTAKLQRSFSSQAASLQQCRIKRCSGARRQSAGNSMSRPQPTPIGAPMNRSLTAQPSVTAMDMAENTMASMSSMQELGMMSRLKQDEPANAFLVGGGRSGDMPDYSTLDIGTNVLDYLSTLPTDEEFASAPPDYLQYNAVPNTSAPPSLSSGSDSIPEPMSRESSNVPNFLGPRALARTDSNVSPSLERYPSHEMFSIESTEQSQEAPKTLYPNDFVGMGSSFNTSVDSVPMSRSISNISNISNLSMRTNSSRQGERAKEAHERHIQNSLRNQIAPKPSGDADKPDSPSSAPKKDGKMALTKKEYQRPKHPKVFCDKCNIKPDGFRGAHELSRHQAAKHSRITTKWQVRDPRQYGIETSIMPILPLNKCKACQANKLYGAYYNVAAHLRRSHFREKLRKGSKKGNIQPQSEKIGGEEPSMPELKKWLIEVRVEVDGFNAADVGGDAADDSAVVSLEDADNEPEFNFADMPPRYSSVPELSTSPETNESLSSSPYELPLNLSSEMAFNEHLFGVYPKSSAPSTSVYDYPVLAEEFAMPSLIQA